MRASDWKWAIAGIGAHLLLLAAIALQNGGLEPVWSIHDATYYTAHLADPLLQGDLDWWGNLTYRAIRVGYILLALPFRWLGVSTALILVNLFAVGGGVLAVRRIAKQHGGSSTLSTLVWVLNPGALMTTALLLPDTIAWTMILFTLLAIHRRRWWLASLLAVFAVLTKEASLVAIGAAGLVGAWSIRDWRPALPALAGGVVHLSLLTILTRFFGPSTHGDFVVWTPLRGWIEVFDIWIPDRTRSLVVGLFVFASGVLVFLAWWRRRRCIFLAGAAGQAALMLFLDAVVIFPMSNSPRIAGLFWPVLVATHGPGSDNPDPVHSETNGLSGVDTTNSRID